jgi:hypothetical protein
MRSGNNACKQCRSTSMSTINTRPALIQVSAQHPAVVSHLYLAYLCCIISVLSCKAVAERSHRCLLSFKSTAIPCDAGLVNPAAVELQPYGWLLIVMHYKGCFGSDCILQVCPHTPSDLLMSVYSVLYYTDTTWFIPCEQCAAVTWLTAYTYCNQLHKGHKNNIMTTTSHNAIVPIHFAVLAELYRWLGDQAACRSD